MNPTIARALNRLSIRLRLLAGRAVISLVNDGLKEQEVQLKLLSGEVGRAERYQHYGFTSRPHPDAEAVFICAGGSRDHIITVADGDRRYRLKSLAGGEVALYDDQGQAVHLKRGKKVHIYGCDELIADAAVQAVVTSPLVKAVASTKVTLETPLVECTQNAQVGGNLVVAGNGSFGGGLAMTGASGSGDITTPGDISDGVRSMAGDRTIYNGHTHNDPQGGTTGAPNQQQ